jgi:hypothetical protein
VRGRSASLGRHALVQRLAAALLAGSDVRAAWGVPVVETRGKLSLETWRPTAGQARRPANGEAGREEVGTSLRGTLKATEGATLTLEVPRRGAHEVGETSSAALDVACEPAGVVVRREPAEVREHVRQGRLAACDPAIAAAGAGALTVATTRVGARSLRATKHSSHDHVLQFHQ